MLNTVENLRLNIYIKENKMRKLKESAMAELDIAAQEAATFEAFVQTVKQEFPQLAKDLNKSEVISFLQNLYDDSKVKQENKTTMKKSQLAQIIREEIQKIIAEAEPDFAKVDSILKGTYKRPAAKVDPKIKKIAKILDTLVSKPFDSAKLEDILNALGPIEPMKLESAIDMMKTSVFELNDGYPFYNLEVRSNNYTDKGVALSWEDDDTWRAG